MFDKSGTKAPVNVEASLKGFHNTNNDPLISLATQ